MALKLATRFSFLSALFLVSTTLHASSFQTDLPILRIQSESPIYDLENYVKGAAELETKQGAIPINLGGLQIKGHGNSTWGMPKRPYRVKFDSKQSLIGMAKHKDWLLIANYTDKTQLRNDVGLELSKRLGLKYTPQSVFVELILNGQYEGLYQLTEKIEIDSKRLDIKELKETDTDPELITGGYLLEIDHKRRYNETGFETKLNIPFTVKEPGKITPDQLAYIQSFIQNVEDRIFSSEFADPNKGYSSVIDVQSFIDWYLLMELTKNNDAIFWTSVYLFKDRGGKLSMGPAWDFDIALGNCDYNDMANPEGWWIRKASWYERLFQDPVFKQRVRARWNQIKPVQLDTLFDYIDSRAAYLSVSQKNNFSRWPILDQYVWPNAKVTGSYKGEIDYLKSYLAARMSWMDQHL